MLLFERLLERFREHNLLREREKQGADSTHVLAAVRALNRLSCIGQTFRHTLNVLATVASEWLLHHSQAEWAKRYAKRVELEHDVPPVKRAEREAFEAALAADGHKRRTVTIGAVVAKGSAGGNDAVAGVDTEFYLGRGGSVAPQKQGRDPFGSGLCRLTL